VPPSDLYRQTTPRVPPAPRGQPQHVADPSVDEGTGLTVAVHHHTSVPALVVEVTGDVDMLTAPRLLDALHTALRAPYPVLVVDLTGVQFMGSAGLSALVNAHRRAGSSTSVRIVAPALTTLRPLQVTGLDAVLNVYQSRPDALR
jgi:anti-sigma B factor antagonist